MEKKRLVKSLKNKVIEFFSFMSNPVGDKLINICPDCDGSGSTGYSNGCIEFCHKCNSSGFIEIE
jgi:DnaJ-class molecular chaperone